MERLLVRLEILKNSNVIGEDTYNKMTGFISRLRDKWEIPLTEENGSMMITHTAMALERIKRGEAVNAVDENVYREVLESDKLNEVEKIFEDLEINIFKEKIPEEEKKYIYVNLLLIKNEK